MPIQKECENCKRKNGYTSDQTTGLCERCLKAKAQKKQKKANDDE